MAAYKNLGDELKCPICKDHFKVPKVMGRCLHVACLECLEQLVAARRRTDFFPCPFCREQCNIPTQGVAALKDDFRIRAIVEEYRNLGKDKDVIHCIACSNPASHFCKACENSYLCKACSGQHSRDPLTTAHEAIGICRKHSKTLTLYCRKCNTAICTVCLICDHPSSSQEHDVVPHQEVADEEVSAVAAAVEKLETTEGRKENDLSTIKRIRDGIVATVDSDLSMLGKQSDSVIEEANKTRDDLEADKIRIQEEIKALTKRMKAVDEAIFATDDKISSARQKNNEYAGYLNMYRDSCLERFEEAEEQIVVETDEIKFKIRLGREETSLKRVLDDQTVPSLQEVKEELVQTLTTAEQVERVAPFVDATGTLPRFVPASAPMEIGHIRRRVFTKLRKSADISFPSCDFIYGVGHLPNGNIACLYMSNIDADKRAGTIGLRMHDPAFSAMYCPVLMDKDIHPAVGMTVTTKGELMVLREEEPTIRIFRNGDMRDIDIGKDFDGNSTVCSVECDEEDNIFIAVSSFDGSDSCVCVFNPSGVLITEVHENLYFNWHPGMSYCRLERTLYIADGDTILRYHWDGTTLKKMPSIVLGVDNDSFTCTDVCIGDGGEVLVAGTLPSYSDFGMESGEYTIMIFQVVEADKNENQVEGQQALRQKDHATASTDDEATFDSSQEESKRTKFNVIELNFDDKVESLTFHHFARISIFGNTLALGHGDTLKLFHLIA